MKKELILFVFFCCLFIPFKMLYAETAWEHISTESGDLDAPNPGKQQTATAIADVDLDGDNDFFITERSEAPSVVLYLRDNDGWDIYIVDDTKQRIEAGSAVHDIDGDGDPDVVFGGDGGSQKVWWWENPYPDLEPNTPWKRHIIKESGGKKHHDQLFIDYDGDGAMELTFWNQGETTLYVAEIPDEPAGHDGPWERTAVYVFSEDSEMQQRGTYPHWRHTNEHEGLAACDIDGDGIMDIIGGGRWYKRMQDGSAMPNIVDASYAFSRSAAGQLIAEGRPEIVMVVGDGVAPLVVYEWQDGTWMPNILIEGVDNGHSLDIVDFNDDGFLDIFCAEMNLGENDDAKTWLIYGDGAGNFDVTVALEGYANHESRIADLDDDGDYDILGKPYKWKAPRLDIWLQK